MSRISASKLRSGKASTVKRAVWPGSTPPMSASSIAAFSSMFSRSAAMTNSTGACMRGGDRLAGIDRAGQHDAVDRRIDRALLQVGLLQLQVGLGDGEIGLGDRRRWRRRGRARRWPSRAPGRRPCRASTAAAERASVCSVSFSVVLASVTLACGGLHRGLGALDLGGETHRVEFGQHVALLDDAGSRRRRPSAPRPTIRSKCRPGSAAAACRWPTPRR